MSTLPWPNARSTATAHPPSNGALRARVALLCHVTRIAAVCWAGWMLLQMIWMWSDPAKIMGMVGRYLNADLGALSRAQAALAFAASVVGWLPDVVVAYCIWRLFGTYLSGRIFTADATAWVQRIGICGLIAVLINVVARRIVWLILTSHAGLPLTTRVFSQLVVPTDLLQVLFCLFVLAIGCVFGAAVQIADDNAGIV